MDDLSDKEHLKTKLEEYLKNMPRIRLIRATKRLGIMRARILGADESTGDVIIFMDSHSEMNSGWIEPLLNRIRNGTCTDFIIKAAY